MCSIPQTHFGQLPKTELSELLLKVVKFTNVSVGRIKSPCRKQETTIARHLFCFLAREIGYTLFHIGLEIKRDHASVIYAIKQCKEVKHLVDLVIKFKQCYTY